MLWNRNSLRASFVSYPPPFLATTCLAMTLLGGIELATRKVIAAKPESELTATELEDLLTSDLVKLVRQLGSGAQLRHPDLQHRRRPT
jgi:predicted RNA binding protein YcfA (HicA-like mRNA interferase family)